MVDIFSSVAALPELIVNLYKSIATVFTRPIVIGVAVDKLDLLRDLQGRVIVHPRQLWACSCENVVFLVLTKNKYAKYCDLVLTRKNIADISGLCTCQQRKGVKKCPEELLD